jgi:hypothetical protein
MCDVKYSDVEGTDVIYLKWFCLEVQWSEVKCSKMSYVKVLGDKSSMCNRVTLYCGYLNVLWIFHLVCILHCGCFNLFCNVWVCVCVGVLRIVCVCVCVLVICLFVFTVFCIICTVLFYCFVYVYLFLFVLSVLV